MRCLTKTIDYKYKEPVRLVLFSDTHVGSRYFARKHFVDFLANSMDHPNAWIIGVGDQIDAICAADQKRFQISTLAKEYLVTDNPDDIMYWQAIDFCELMKPYKGRIITLASGNHEVQWSKRYGFPIHQFICNVLECDNGGYSFLLLLKLTDPEYRRTRSVTIYGIHGFGAGGRTEGGPLTKYSRLIQYYAADLYITGHDHSAFTHKVARVGLNNNGKIQHRDMILVNCGAFVKTLTDNETPSYSELKGYAPRNLGGCVIDLTPDKNGWMDTKIID